MPEHGPARRGRRVPLATLTKPKQAEPTGIYVCGAKPLKFREYTLTEGVEVPGAADWPRLEAWVNCRRVRQLGMGEVFTSFESFVDSLPKPVPDDVTGAAVEDDVIEESEPILG